MPDQVLKPNANVRPSEEQAPGIPRWLKISGIIVIILILLFVTLHLAGNSMGSGMHMGPGTQMPPTEQETQQP
jgi:hypothetical protein